VRSELTLSQRELGDICKYERRTVMRWEHGSTLPSPWDWEAMARAVHPSNADLAGKLAAAAGQTLVSLGLEAPPPPPPPPAPPPPPPAPPPPATAHLVDSIVCAAAEAMQLTPAAIRPALVAAFERAAALHMEAGAVLSGLGSARAEPTAP
jgi:hypothetical protein